MSARGAFVLVIIVLGEICLLLDRALAHGEHRGNQSPPAKSARGQCMATAEVTEPPAGFAIVGYAARFPGAGDADEF